LGHYSHILCDADSNILWKEQGSFPIIPVLTPLDFDEGEG
jgi:hypothetical protein